MLKAIIFDMDGVIIDSEPQHAKAGVLAAKKFGADIDESYCYKFIGTTTYYMCQCIVEEFNLSISAKELLEENEYQKKLLVKTEGYIPVPHVIDLIKSLYENGLDLIIASSSPMHEIKSAIESLNLTKYFKEYVTGMSVKNPKPAPDVFLKALDVIHASSEEAIIIEDSMNGCLAAKAANIPCIAIINPNSGKQDLSSAGILVESFEEVDFSFVKGIYDRVHQIP